MGKVDGVYINSQNELDANKFVDQSMTKRVTWDSRTTPENHVELIARMRASGLPLRAAGTGENEESSKSTITALVSFVGGGVDAYVATPSGLLYRFTTVEMERDWWSFALRYYYVVTGNMQDRLLLAEKAGVEIGEIKGKTLSQAKAGSPSGLTLEQLLHQVCPQQVALLV